MATKVILPKFGQTVETSEITQWMVSEGDRVAKGDVLCEISTDKSALEVESLHEGVLLRILLPQGREAPVGCVIALIGEADEAIDEALVEECLATQEPVAKASADEAPAASAEAAPAPAVRPDAPPPPPPPAPAAAPEPPPHRQPARPSAGGRPIASPRARRLARERQVPLEALGGTGESGRIVERDVRAYLEAVGPVAPAARAIAYQRGIDLRTVRGSGAGGRIQVADLAAAAPAGAAATALPEVVAAEPPPLRARLEQPSAMRRAIATNMVRSATTIPAFTLEVTVDAAAMIERRQREQEAGRRISYNDLIAKAVAIAVRHHQAFASTWADDGIRYHDRVNIGLAVAVPDGLIVPVIPDCDRASIEEINRWTAHLVAKARDGQLAPEEYRGAVFTLSNLGMLPVDRFTAIVPPGQSGILAIGRIREELIPRDGGLFPTRALSLTLSADHRIVDGYLGARFMADVKALLEHADRL